ncbi:MAG TPA: NADH-quinone oxidoreductase subunit L, partial [Bacteroidales bacterium]|nr:NADH-quinone oxidoreductase subunit L [Bacteroidales bacterium]
MNHFSYTIWIPLIPMFMFLILGLGGEKFKPVVSGILGTIGMGVSFFLSLLTAWLYFFSQGLGHTHQTIIAFNNVWLNFTDKL